MTTTVQQNLFSDAPAPVKRSVTRESEQRRKAGLAYAATCEVWKAAVYEYAVNVFLPRSNEFIFESLTSGYEKWAKGNGKPATVNSRAFAGLQKRLLREGQIVAVEGKFGKRTQGSFSQIYRKV